MDGNRKGSKRRLTWQNALMVLLDVVAVNAAYLLALLLRFYANNVLHPETRDHFAEYLRFAPWYTVICIVVFALLGLYHGIWKYVGLNDINKILLSSVITTVIQVVGTVLFVARMPITYYAMGAMFQFEFVTIIRCAYRILSAERKRLLHRGRAAENVMIVGAGEGARRVMHYLEESTERNFRPVCIIDDKNGLSGMTMNGVPVLGGPDQIEEALTKYKVANVFIANPLLDNQLRRDLKEMCEERKIDLRDYAGYLLYMEDSNSLEGLLQMVKAPTIMRVQGADKRIIPFSPPDIGEKEIGEVVEALSSGWITTGPRTKLLERRLTAYVESGNPLLDTEQEPDRWKDRMVCLNSATAAEELNLRLLGVGPGDEVIVPAYSYTASASAVIHCGATVRFVDIQKDGDGMTHMPEMDYDALEAAINERTKAVVTVDLGGIVCDYDRVFEIVERKRSLFTPMTSDGTVLPELSAKIQRGLGRVAVIADAAHALGASRVVSHTGRGALAGPEKKYVGRIADLTSFSFHAVKNFTTAEGGASTWCLPDSVYAEGVTDEAIYKMLQLLSLHGQNKDALAKTKVGAWEYDIIGPWYKCNMTDIMAAIGLRQLDRYGGLLARRVDILSRYDAMCDELGVAHLLHHVGGMDSSNHLYLVRIPGLDEAGRNEIIEKMAQAGVATNVHYKPMPMMTAYRQLGWDIQDFPNTYDYYRNLITLPLHTLLSDEDVDYVCETFRRIVSERKG